jgi:hypothetical protein
MSKTKEEFMKQQFTGSLDERGDEDYLYEQYLIQEKLNEEYWQWLSIKENKESVFSDDVHRDKPHSIFPDEVQYDDEYYKSSYLPTKEEEEENFKLTFDGKNTTGI